MANNEPELIVRKLSAAWKFTSPAALRSSNTLRRHCRSRSYTLIPPSLEGRGIAATLSRAGLKLAQAADVEVVTVCPFVKAYILRHPKYAALVRSEPPDETADWTGMSPDVHWIPLPDRHRGRMRQASGCRCVHFIFFGYGIAAVSSVRIKLDAHRISDRDRSERV